MGITYTRADRTEKKYTIGHAIENARQVLATHRIHEICVNAVRQRDHSTRLTLVELNELQEQLIDDSKFYHIA